MQRTLASGFDDSFRRHLAVEQRRAVLDTIARELTPDTTLGDIVDAAQDLGWGDSLGELRLADLAGALLGDAPPAAPAHRAPEPDEDAPEREDEDDELDAASDDDDASDDDASDDDEDEQDDEDEDEEPEVEAAPARRGRKPAAKAEPATAPRKPSSLDRALDRIDKALAARGRKSRPEARAAAKKAPAAPTPAPAKATSKKAAAKKAAAKKAPSKKVAAIAARLSDDDTDAMSLDQAAKMLVPLVRKLREATMQDLEEQTGMGRRKLRFHIGQLVKHGRLKRHGMGRGTCYTVK